MLLSSSPLSAIVIWPPDKYIMSLMSPTSGSLPSVSAGDADSSKSSLLPPLVSRRLVTQVKRYISKIKDIYVDELPCCPSPTRLGR